MSLEPRFPFEFIVEGVPVSHQNRGRRSLHEWKTLIRAGYAHLLPDGHWATDQRIYATIFYFPDGVMEGDIDNIVKPILDAMSGHVYFDDHQVERVLVQKFEPHRLLTFLGATETLARALEWARPTLYIRLDTERTLGGVKA